MAVYDRGYRGYSGRGLTPQWSRFLVLARYALVDVFASRAFLVFFVVCLLWPLACTMIIYLHYNFEALTALDLEILDLIRIDGRFFRSFYLEQQSSFAFLLALVVGPALISPDLRNNAMPLLLSRPISKLDYALGKWVVLALLLSATTWIPGLVLFFLQAYLAGWEWLVDNARIGVALFVGSWVWILVLSLFALAISAWVKWKPWARIVFFGGFFTAMVVAEIFKGLYGTWYGSLVNPFDLVQRIWDQLFGLESDLGVPVLLAWIAFGIFWGLCLLLLFRRIRAYEVAT
jgi:ABC-type transport system involved in multi-copper enzyme maturation permease subunit